MDGMNFTDNLVLYNYIFTETVSYTFCMESLGIFFTKVLQRHVKMVGQNGER